MDLWAAVLRLMISIHALRVEGDNPLALRPEKMSCISIHALRVEGDIVSNGKAIYEDISIHALRVEGDCPGLSARTDYTHFYPRPPGGGRQNLHHRLWGVGKISIHALRVEGDLLLHHPACH